MIFSVVRTALASPAAETILYNRDVRPILADACFKCHGPDNASRHAGFCAKRREAAIEAGAAPHKPR